MEPDYLLKMPFMNTKGATTLGHTFRNFDQTIITIKVGSKDYPESFSCHRELLRRCSPYFNTCLEEKTESPYKSSATTLELEDTHPDVFDAFMLWLYTGFIPHHLIEGGKEIHPPTHAISVQGEDSSSHTDGTDTEDVDTTSWGLGLDNDDAPAEATPAPVEAESTPAPAIAEKVPGDVPEPEKAAPVPPPRNPAEKHEAPKETLCPCCSRPYKWRGLEGFLERRFISLYVFAHRYAITRLRRAVLLAWQTNDEILQVMPDHSNVIAAYESLPPDAPLCRYFLDMYSVYWNPDRDDERTIALRSQLPQAFLFELATVLARGERPKIEKEWCEFHEHENEEDRKACLDEMSKDPVASKALRRIKDSKGWKGLVLKKGKR
ncbi:BTB domain containing protein [Pyrenophora tritici-repentis]|uniref:BTB domain containing protein n=3 Tax=Pyrenophora tritici-repentis TaxID=45151 RepID=A0A2W1EX92_9PLEO|nr:BTB domain-containing protein [Pyrenophora tritici-repentis]KAF7449549.1 BTB domain containing protein [Pyrenophora tritici-repentis]KAF7570338.1 BTB domain containing protein [Pyrenophora tritici-repentis]KAG9383512.1 BTB domain containing protein [Pyrenophora tritici-repentis]KAI0574534.1 BTB domain-containing protein [Pyrenophora tritici-repentis]